MTTNLPAVQKSGACLEGGAGTHRVWTKDREVMKRLRRFSDRYAVYFSGGMVVGFEFVVTDEQLAKFNALKKRKRR